MSTFFFSGQDIIEIGQKQLDQVKQAAVQAPLKRSRLCLHHSHDDKVQEMVIAFCHESYVRPHRHLNKSESFHVIEGELAVVFFDDDGHITRRIMMGPPGCGRTFLYRLATSQWHTVAPLSEFVVIHETTAGPVINEETEYAAWGPDEADSDRVRAFLLTISTRPID